MSWYTEYIEAKDQNVNQKVLTNKFCSCGKQFLLLPRDARIQLSPDKTKVAGWHFECLCNNTLFVTNK